ncbi:type II secretion system F family protein [Novipirellula sp. SH528]|uniref:type II secretion system F family protein n=1 Tax=Novipirellula sp. SH528 TaxID=3454466 RepID=UPI003FA113C0
MTNTLNLVMASICAASSVYLACRWYVPWARSVLQKPIEPYLKRTGEIGFDEEYFRNMTFAIEVTSIIGLLWTGYIYMGTVLAVTVFGISVHLRTLIFSWLVESRERLLRSQTSAFTAGLMSLTRSGLSLSQAFDSVAGEMPMPLGRQVQRIAMEHRRGRPLAESIDAVRTQLRLDAFSLLVTSITCALKQGASLEASLTGVQESLKHRADSERQLFAKTSNARNTILILACTTPGFFLMFWLMMPDSMEIIFQTEAGKKMLAAILLLLYGGIAWSRNLLKFK